MSESWLPFFLFFSDFHSLHPTMSSFQGGEWILGSRNRRNLLKCWVSECFFTRNRIRINLWDQIHFQHIFSFLTLVAAPSHLLWSLPLEHTLFIAWDSSYVFRIWSLLRSFCLFAPSDSGTHVQLCLPTHSIYFLQFFTVLVLLR